MKMKSPKYFLQFNFFNLKKINIFNNGNLKMSDMDLVSHIQVYDKIHTME